MANHKVEHLTDRQEQLLRLVRMAITDEGDAPTVAELVVDRRGAHADRRGKLGELEAKNAIVREPHQPRGIRLA